MLQGIGDVRHTVEEFLNLDSLKIENLSFCPAVIQKCVVSHQNQNEDTDSKRVRI